MRAELLSVQTLMGAAAEKVRVRLSNTKWREPALSPLGSRREESFPGLGPRAYCVTVDGDGLRRKFAKGDVVIVEPDRIPQPGDVVVLYGNAKIAAIAEHDGHPGLFHAIAGKVSHSL